MLCREEMGFYVRKVHGVLPGCIEASRTRWCMTWPVDAPPLSSSQPNFSLCVLLSNVTSNSIAIEWASLILTDSFE